ncbi:hypothetical protein KSD_03940 [Ktedonobacter sp. SOSP1-85]|uniref:DUF2225 domain-containing protein n=1 Tax=Ktedonobacter robiniae TaxID=2778365 RepID=A0ABQ3UHH2_9CHLR|nr:hypothetical protein KSB_06340 [Ktedonobacter robiniae]GHO72623.1 hypothetical protein KSD_03940 [Ktedonobacter sp. SOSP1-85]
MIKSRIKPCPECGGQRVYVEAIVSVKIPDTSVMLKQPKRSTPLFSGKSRYSDTVALTCLMCGYTALYATEPANLVPNKE